MQQRRIQVQRVRLFSKCRYLGRLFMEGCWKRLLVKQQEDEEFVKWLELLEQQLKLYNGWQEVRSLC
jgi:hypothetical protein